MLSSLATMLLALLANTVAVATASFCGQWDSTTAADFILYNDLWGEYSATSGSQCTTLNSASGNTIGWQTTWTWQGQSSDVKSYANAVLNSGPVQLSSISSIPVVWDWSYSGSNVVADVSWDLFLSSTDSTSAAHNYEVMVWLAALGGAAPIGYPNAIATTTINGVKFTLYKGTTDWTVFSFVAESETTSFSGDFNNFIKYLTANQGVPSNYYLQTIGAGTEPFTGSGATFSVSKYSISMNA